MSSNPTRKTGKGGKRKIGRASRKPSHNRYTMERRFERNKARLIAKQQRLEERKAAKKARKKALLRKAG